MYKNIIQKSHTLIPLLVVCSVFPDGPVQSLVSKKTKKKSKQFFALHLY